MAELRANNSNASQAAADIIIAIRLELQANSIAIKTLSETVSRIEKITSEHHEALYEGNGKPGLDAQIILLQNALEDFRNWKHAVDLYRENVRPMHTQFHQDMDTLRVETIKGKSAISVALVGAGQALLSVLLIMLLSHFGLILPKK